MIRPIVTDVKFLSQKSQDASFADIKTAIDLIDTLRAHSHECVGMAANMIGVKKRIIAFGIDSIQIAMLNPVIVKKSGRYEAEEGCLSLTGTRMAARYSDIEVEYLDMNMKKQRQSFSGFTAQIIQHEIDHCDGIII